MRKRGPGLSIMVREIHFILDYLRHKCPVRYYENCPKPCFGEYFEKALSDFHERKGLRGSKSDW
jgi:hypothetical protein